MKKKLAIFLAVLLLSCMIFSSAASAESTNILSLGSVTAGVYLSEFQVTSVENLQSIELIDNSSLPSGLSWATRGNLVFLYGTPNAAGTYNFTFTATDSAGEITYLQCSLTVNPATPVVTTGSNVSCTQNEAVTISISASISDNGTVSYQWYSGSVGNGTPISGAVSPAYSPETSTEGTFNFYCVVTNNNNGITSQTASNTISVSIAPVVTVVSTKVISERETYTVGEEVLASDFSLLVTYSNGETVTVTSGFSVSPNLITESGEQSVSVEYQGERYEYAITASLPDEIIESIEILRKPSKLVYNVGDSIDLTDLKIEVTTNLSREGLIDGPQTITIDTYGKNKGIQCSVDKFTAAGTQTVTISLQDQTAEFTVTVNEPTAVLQNIAIDQLPTKASYTVGDTLDTTGLVLKALYTKGTGTEIKNISEGFTCTPTTMTKTGRQQITVTYEGLTCYFTVSVAAASEGGNSGKSDGSAITVTPTPTQSGNNAGQHTGPDPEPDAPSSNHVFIVLLLIIAIIALIAMIAYIYISKVGGWDEFIRRFKK